MTDEEAQIGARIFAREPIPPLVWPGHLGLIIDRYKLAYEEHLLVEFVLSNGRTSIQGLNITRGDLSKIMLAGDAQQ